MFNNHYNNFLALSSILPILLSYPTPPPPPPPPPHTTPHSPQRVSISSDDKNQNIVQFHAIAFSCGCMNHSKLCIYHQSLQTTCLPLHFTFRDSFANLLIAKYPMFTFLLSLQAFDFKVGDNSLIIHKSAYYLFSVLISKLGFSSLQTRKTFSKILSGKYRFLIPVIRVVFHLAEFSARSDIFFRLLTPTFRQSIFKQKKMPLRTENSIQWKMALRLSTDETRCCRWLFLINDFLPSTLNFALCHQSCRREVLKKQKVIDSFSLFERENASTRFSDRQLFLIDNTKYVSVLLLSRRKYDRWRFVIFVFPGLLYFHPIQIPNSAALQAWSSFKMSAFHDAMESSTEETLLNSVKNLTAQKEVRPVKKKLNTDAATATAKASTSEVKNRSSNFSLQEKLDLADIVCTGKDTTNDEADNSLHSEVFIATLRSKTVPNKLKKEIYGKIAKRLCQRKRCFSTSLWNWQEDNLGPTMVNTFFDILSFQFFDFRFPCRGHLENFKQSKQSLFNSGALLWWKRGR